MASGLSDAQREHYREQGYVIARGVLTQQEVERYRARAAQVARGDHPAGAASRIMRDIHFAKGLLPTPDDPELALWKIMNPDRFDATLGECLRIPRLLDAVASLVGDDLLGFLLQFLYKPPRVPQSIHPFHQDGLFFSFQPHDLVVGCWIALDDTCRENGTLCVVPGSHRLPVTKHGAMDGVNKSSFHAEGVEGDPEWMAQAVALALSPGDAILFHPHLYHRTEGNSTDNHRRVFTVHFASARCTPAAEAIIREFGFTSVRGRTYEGCLQPLADPDLGFRL